MKNRWIVALTLSSCLMFAPSGVNAAESAEVDAADEASVAARLEDARQRLDEAAREVAELSAEQVKSSFGAEWMHRGALGVVLAPSSVNGGSKNGLVIAGVTPGGGAAKAGLRAGDVIVAIGGVAVDASESAGAFPRMKMLRALDEVEPGETVRVDYERDGATASVDVVTQEHPSFAAFGAAGMGTFELAEPPEIEFIEGFPAEPVEPLEPMEHDVMFTRKIGRPPLMLHDLDANLGRYFGVTEGVLVLSAPEGDQGLLAGDVIKSVAGAPVTSTAATYRSLMLLKEDAAVEVLRDGGVVTVQVKPGTGPGFWTAPFAGRQIRSVRVIRNGAEGADVEGSDAEGDVVDDTNIDVIVREQ